jgi:hypothetical protein
MKRDDVSEATAGLFPFDYPSLYHEDARRLPVIRRWRGPGGGGVGLHEPFDLAADRPPGLVKLGGGFDRDIQLTIGRATRHVATIGLVNDQRTAPLLSSVSLWKREKGGRGSPGGPRGTKPPLRSCCINLGGAGWFHRPDIGEGCERVTRG